MIRIDGLSFQVGGFRVDRIDLAVADGEYFVLMGPNGAGKSLLVQCICGLVAAAAGRIEIDGRDVTGLAPRLRRVGYMPQDGALFPHMSAGRNVTFARRLRGGSRAAAERDCRAIIDMLGLTALLSRRCDTLSGGERQKVALARALAIRPSLLLLDEPVSALDEPTRREVCGELLRVQRKLGVATIHICHNAEEARSLADRVGVMHQGRIVQCGSLDDLRAEPAEPIVARLLGCSRPHTNGRDEARPSTDDERRGPLEPRP